MAEDSLDIADIEHAVLNGRVKRIEKYDPRGNKYVIEGLATDGVTPVGVVGRYDLGIPRYSFPLPGGSLS